MAKKTIAYQTVGQFFEDHPVTRAARRPRHRLPEGCYEEVSSLIAQLHEEGTLTDDEARYFHR